MLAVAVTFVAVCSVSSGRDETYSTYRYIDVSDEGGKLAEVEPVPALEPPLWATDVNQGKMNWTPVDPDESFFQAPIPFVVPPEGGGDEPFYGHNHQPDIAWLPTGDLLAIWYTTRSEQGTELTVLASRFRTGRGEWDPASEFFKAENRNMHGNSLFYDDSTGKLHHLNGMGRAGATGWENLALLHRYSRDNGVTWSLARPVSSGAHYQRRHQVIAGIARTPDGVLIQPCDGTPTGQGPTAIHLSRDGGQTWSDPGGDVRGIHAGVEALSDGWLIALGRGQAIDGRMPMSISGDMGATWQYAGTEFPVIGGGQRLVLMRLHEGPLLLVSFTEPSVTAGRTPTEGMEFTDETGETFIGYGMFAALSYDDGRTWPVRKLLTPGEGTYDGKGWTGRFEATPTRAEPGGYLAATQTPDNLVHLISSGLHYRFNLKWLETPAAAIGTK